MAWHGIEGHDEIVELFRRAIRRGRLASSFLFVGPAGIGKRTFAIALAQALLCRERDEALLDPCGVCPSCTQVLAGTHPDLLTASKPAEKSFLPLELLIGDKEHRMRQGLCHDIAMKPFMGGRKIAVIDDADHLNAEGANCLLKTLEEPPPRSILILIGTSAARQLPTIRSRCQILRFRPLSEERTARVLLARGLASDAEEANRWARHGGGSVRQAVDSASPDLWDFRGRLFALLERRPIDGVRASAAVAAFVDEAGKEASARRARMRHAVGFATEFFLAVLRALAEEAAGEALDGPPWLHTAAARWTGADDVVTACLDRCLDAGEQIERNANPSTLVECWLDDLARIASSPAALRSLRA